MNFLICTTDIDIKVTVIIHQQRTVINKGNNKITELQTILQREVKTHKYINRQNQSTTGKL